MNAECDGRGAEWQDLRAWGGRLLRTDGADAARREAETLWTDMERRAALDAEKGRFRPLAYVAAAFSLSRFAHQCLALAFLAQADEDFAAALGGGLSPRRALRLLTGPGLPPPECLRDLSDSGLLSAYCLDPETDELRPAGRIAEFVLGEAWDEPGTPGLSLLLPEPEAPVPEALAALAERMDTFLNGASERVTFLLQGRTGAGRRTLAGALGARRREPLVLADGRFLTGDGAEPFRRAVLREALLQRSPVCFTGLDDVFTEAGSDPASAQALAELLRETAAPAGFSLLACGEGPVPWEEPAGWRAVSVVLGLPSPEESQRLWSAALAVYPQAEAPDTAELAGKYRFTPGQMERAAADADAIARWRGLPGLDEACLTEGCRRQLHHALGDRARLVESVFTWDELILPETSKRLLRSACDQVKHRPKVLDEWGFGRKLAYGAGLSMLFSGPPGTGKTMAAQIVAGELGLELYKVDLSAVVSKYVGETEKNLGEIFREAARSQAILFFDEADVLFGKRTEVKDAHDKYNNMEAAYLLQKIEEYPGISVLATNFLQNFDEAFKRRLKFIIEFPFPDAGYRLALWRAVFPARTPLSPDVDWEYLAQQFELSGSGIKNTAVNAAYLAAGENAAVGMSHLLTALKRELMKSGKLLRREDFGAYYMLVE